MIRSRLPILGLAIGAEVVVKAVPDPFSSSLVGDARSGILPGGDRHIWSRQRYNIKNEKYLNRLY